VNGLGFQALEMRQRHRVLAQWRRGRLNGSAPECCATAARRQGTDSASRPQRPEYTILLRYLSQQFDLYTYISEFDDLPDSGSGSPFYHVMSGGQILGSDSQGLVHRDLPLGASPGGGARRHFADFGLDMSG
jgi:hypothetical protein